MDPLVSLLSQIAGDLLVDPTTTRVRQAQHPNVHPDAVRAHPKFAEFMELLSNEPSFSSIFPDDDEVRGIERPYRPRNVAPQLLNAVLWNAKLYDWSDVASLERELERAFETFRKLATTGRLVGTTVTGISGTLPPDTKIETKWGVLKDARSCHEVLKRGLIMVGEHTVEGWCVLESKTKIYWEVKPGERVRQDRLQGINDTGAPQVALAIMLTKGPQNYRPAIPWLSTRINPLMGGVPGGGWRSRVIEGPQISPTELPILERWLAALASHEFPKVSIDRVITMINRNAEHVDAFIDAVIIWENLFSARQTQEVSFRVSMNMACVLSDDSRERVTFQKEIKKLYDLRSKVVHGAHHLDDIGGREVRMRAQEITITAMQRLLSAHPALVGAQSDQFIALVLGRPS